VTKHNEPEDQHLYNLTHARHDPTHCLAPGLFRGLLRGERKATKLDIIYTVGEYEVHFRGPEPLSDDDLRVLQGLVAMAGPKGLVLGPEPKTEKGRQLRLMLDTRWAAIEEDSLMVRGSYRRLAREIGYGNIKDSKPIRDCIERLYTVSIIVRKSGKKVKGYRILSEMETDEVDGKIFVALNPMLTTAIMGGQHVRILMSEVRAIKNAATRIIHQRLCGWIDLGKGGKVAIDKLCSYVWPDTIKASGMRKRRERIRKKVLPELLALGWTVNEYAKGKYEISRPKEPADLETPPVTVTNPPGNGHKPPR